MTLLVAVRSRAALVLASDTADSLKATDGPYKAVWNTAKKVHPLFRADRDGHRPALALMHTGDCRLLEMPVDEAVAGFCRRIANPRSPYHQPRDGFTVESVAAALGRYLSTDCLLAAPQWGWHFEATFLVAAWEPGAYAPTATRLRVNNGVMQPPVAELTSDNSIALLGQTHAVSRLLGASQAAGDARHQFPDLGETECVQMARYLIDVGRGYHRFFTEAPTVGGGVEIATLGPQSGFRWAEEIDRHGKQHW